MIKPALSLLIALTLSSPALAWSPPSAPEIPVYDPDSLLKPAERATLARLLEEHERLVGEQIRIALWKTSPGPRLEDLSHLLFTEWKVGQTGQDNGILLTALVDGGDGSIQAGSAFDGSIKKHSFAFQARTPFASLATTTLDLLRAIQSPLIDSGRALELLESGVPAESWERVPGSGIPWSFAALLIGVLGLAASVYHFACRDRHFSSRGLIALSPIALWVHFKKNSSPGDVHAEW